MRFANCSIDFHNNVKGSYNLYAQLCAQYTIKECDTAMHVKFFLLCNLYLIPSNHLLLSFSIQIRNILPSKTYGVEQGCGRYTIHSLFLLKLSFAVHRYSNSNEVLAERIISILDK